MVSPSPPMFVQADGLLIFDSVEDAESWLEPVDVEPGEVAYDAEGRLLKVVVRGEVRRTGCSIDQSGARVALVPVEARPGHAEALHGVLLDWLGGVDPGADLSGASLAALVERARSWKAGQPVGVSKVVQAAAIVLGLMLLAFGIWWLRAQ